MSAQSYDDPRERCAGHRRATFHTGFGRSLVLAQRAGGSGRRPRARRRQNRPGEDSIAAALT